MNPDKNACLAFVGDFGTKMFTPASQTIERLQATRSFLSSLCLDLNITHIQTAIPGIVDRTPTYAERKAALLHSETMGQAYHTLLTSGANSLVETHLDTKASPAPLLFFLDCHNLVDAIEMLEAVKRRLPLHSLVVITEVSAHDAGNKVVQTGLSDLQALFAEDVIETVIVIDPNSDFAREHGVETQHHFVAQTLISLLVAHKHSLHNRSFASLLHDLHSLSPFTAMSFASETVAIGSVPTRWKFVPGVSGHVGIGNYGDILTQVRAAIDRCVTEEDTRTFPSQVKTDAFCAVLASVPIALNDSRFHACERDTALYCASHYPFATSITVSGNGCPYPHQVQLGSRFRVQASCLYPLQPQAFVRLQEGKQVKVTTLYPLTAVGDGDRSNGHVPADKKEDVTKPTKIVTTARQKKAPASRRVVRKNTKQAQ